MIRAAITRQLSGKEFFGHPSGLFVLFLTEMWERFSFYGMRALLVLYMTNYLLLDPAKSAEVLGYDYLYSFLIWAFGGETQSMTVQQIASQIYGLYTGFVYATPFFGGIIADKILGQRKTVYLGGILMAIGHFLMAIESYFLFALIFIMLGNGCFKPNISTQVGALYKEGDPRSDSAFTIFYMGINIGAFLAPLVCGTLGQQVGWHWGFGAAGVGMIVGLINYWLCEGLLPKDTLKLASESKEEKRSLNKQEWATVFALAFLCFLNVMFWAVYEQQGNTLQIWADQRTNWDLGFYQIPSTWFQAFNPMMIFLFAPILNVFWKYQGSSQPSSVVKMGIGCILVGLAYVLMYLAAVSVPEDQKGSVMWLLATVFMFTMGELYLSPIGLSLVSKVSPTPILNMMMGMWFLSSFFGNYMAGYLGMFYDTMSKENFFLMMTVIGVVTGIVFLVVKKPLTNSLGKDV